jgi:hypothetical protein
MTVTTRVKFLTLAAAACLGAVVLAQAPAAQPAARVVLEDLLQTSTKGKQFGGKFVAGGGWTAVDPDDRIVWELPDTIGDGSLELNLRNFDPPRQVVANKNNLIGMWETLWESGGKKDKPNMDNFMVRVGKNYKQLKLELHTHGFAQQEKALTPLPNGFDATHTYRFKAEWIQGVLTFSLDGEPFYRWISPNSDPMDRFRYVHIGSDPQFKGATPGPVFSHIKVTSIPRVPQPKEE